MKIWQTIFANFFWYFNNVPNSFIVERNHWRCFILEFDLIRVSTFQCSLMQVWIKQKRSWNMLEKSYGSTYAIYYVFKSNELFFLLRIKCSVVHFTLSCSWFWNILSSKADVKQQTENGNGLNVKTIEKYTTKT